MICGWDLQILQATYIVNHDQFSQSRSLDIVRQLSGEKLIVDFLRLFVCEALYHGHIIPALRIHVKRVQTENECNAAGGGHMHYVPSDIRGGRVAFEKVLDMTACGPGIFCMSPASPESQQKEG